MYWSGLSQNWYSFHLCALWKARLRREGIVHPQEGGLFGGAGVIVGEDEGEGGEDVGGSRRG